MKKFISINGSDLPLPLADGYSVSLSDLDSENTNRGEDGVMFRERIRAGVYKVAYQAQVETSELEQILSLISSDKFTVSFYFGRMVTATMYAGDKSINLVSCDLEKDTSYWSVSFNLIEF